jgi:hypothetical protein
VWDLNKPASRATNRKAGSENIPYDPRVGSE